MSGNLDIFRNEYLGANTWPQRKDGVPLYLLDKLSAEELKKAEIELIKSADTSDSWPIIGLGHIKSTGSLPKLYKLLARSNRKMRVVIAHSIFQICGDKRMIDIVLEEVPLITNFYELIDIVYMLPSFKDERITTMLNHFRIHKDYLVAYNATRALGLSTEEIVNKFRNQKATDKIAISEINLPKTERKWWQKIFGTK